MLAYVKRISTFAVYYLSSTLKQMNMIALKNVSFSYKNRKPVLEDMTLEIETGHIYGLLGKNGEGKTTLLNILSGQLFPNSGECRVMDEQPGKRHVTFLQRIFILPEEINLPDVTSREYIDMYKSFYPNFSQEIADLCFREFGIEADKRTGKMSLGQKKKLALALALSVRTPLLLMDEPTNGLDIPSKSVFRRLVAASLDENQLAVISTHQVRDLESLIDSVLIMEDKKILLNQPLDKVSEKLFFRVVAPGEQVLYSEPTVSGLMGVGRKQTLDDDTPVSLELLFQAVVSNPEEIHRIFNN